ncbi:hypothetical protein F01_460537 [Burkholderia cenocepacia]|nr:hypothetical protein F01_460537 [Burkholderia cenocepacia]
MGHAARRTPHRVLRGRHYRHPRVAEHAVAFLDSRKPSRAGREQRRAAGRRQRRAGRLRARRGTDDLDRRRRHAGHARPERCVPAARAQVLPLREPDRRADARDLGIHLSGRRGGRCWRRPRRAACLQY